MFLLQLQVNLLVWQIRLMSRLEHAELELAVVHPTPDSGSNVVSGLCWSVEQEPW